MSELHNDDEAYQGRKIGKMIKAVSLEHSVETWEFAVYQSLLLGESFNTNVYVLCVFHITDYKIE